MQTTEETSLGTVSVNHSEIRTPPSALRTRHCPLCGHEEARLLVRGNFNLSGATADYRVVACQDCGFRFLHPRPDEEELARFYQADYAAHALQLKCDGPATREQASLNRRFHQMAAHRCRIIQRFRPLPWDGLRVLDVGCGNGSFLLEMARQHPVEAWGVDLSETTLAAVAEQAALREVKLRLVKGELASVQLPPAHYDVITLWHMLEHDGDPVRSLRRARQWLRPGGLLLAEVPNSDGLIARLCGGSWLGWDMPRHLVHFTAESLGRAARQAGFGRVRVLHEYTLDPISLSPLLASLAIWRQRRKNRTRMKRVAYRRFDGVAGMALRLINGVERMMGGNGLLLVAGMDGVG
jgi:SAM-dependent methyltransferase